MSTTNPPPFPGFGETFRQFVRQIEELGHHATARHALCALLAGNIDTARTCLARLPASYLDRLAPATLQLAELARLFASLEDRS